jgi:hypothetical protein
MLWFYCVWKSIWCQCMDGVHDITAKWLERRPFVKVWQRYISHGWTIWSGLCNLCLATCDESKDETQRGEKDPDNAADTQ